MSNFQHQLAPPKKKRTGRTVAIVGGSIFGGLVVLGVIGSFLPDNTVKTADSAPLPNVVTTTTAAPEPVVTPTNKPAPVKTTAPKPVPTKTTAAPKPLSVSQEQAIESAEDYIDSGDFSRKSLIEQLKFEGFTTKEAAYAVDHITVNWTAEADDSAASYLESGSFSRKSLMDQLLYEGFTKAQAAHGVKSVGL